MNHARLTDQCAQTVIDAVPKVMRAIREEMRRQGAPLFSIPQLRTLVYLHRRPGSCLFHLADHLGVTRPTASAIVDRLVRRGMLARAKDPQERRRVLLTLTPEGARHLERARRSTQAWMAHALSGMSPINLRYIMHGLTLLAEPFIGAGGGDGSSPRGGLAGGGRRRASGPSRGHPS